MFSTITWILSRDHLDSEVHAGRAVLGPGPRGITIDHPVLGTMRVQIVKLFPEHIRVVSRRWVNG